MVKIAIRDDDASFFTHPEDILNVYSDLGDFPISYAVVPYMLTNSYNGGNCKELKDNNVPRWFGENKELVETMKKLIALGRIEILLHGFTHEYHLVGGEILPEFLWRSAQDSEAVIANGKKYLEEVFGVKINWFVAPSNMINSANFYPIIENGMNFSGLISLSFNRPKTFKSFKNYLFRFFHRAFHKFGYPGLLDYGTHKEIYACPIVRGNYLYKMYAYCKKNNLPMVINSHYWDIRDNKSSRETLFDFVKFALNDGAKPCLISELL